MFQNVMPRLAGACLLVAVGLGSSAAQAPGKAPSPGKRPAPQSALPPTGVRADEEYIPFKTCGMVMKKPVDEATRKAMHDIYAEETWEGECRNGLANGSSVTRRINMGHFDNYPDVIILRTAEYIAGRATGKIGGSVSGNTDMSFVADGSVLTLGNTDTNFRPNWSDNSSKINISTNKGIDQYNVTAIATPCGKSSAPVLGCDAKHDFLVYGVQTTKGPKGSASVTTVSCPDPKSPNGCETVWRQALEPVMPAITKIMAAQAAQEADLRREGPALQAMWDNAVKAQADARAAAADTAARDAQTKLKAANAGELFVMATTAQKNGDMAGAEAARNALITRFPNSPLAATAAQQAMAASAPAPQRSVQTAQNMATQAPAESGSCKEQLDQHARVIDAATSRQNSSQGSKMIFVHMMWIFSSTMQILDNACRGQPEYQMYPGLQQRLDEARTSCTQISSDNGETCVPTKVW